MRSVRESYKDLRSIPIGYRASQLRALQKMIEDNIAKFEEAVWKDLRKVRVKTKNFILLSYLNVELGCLVCIRSSGVW